MEDLYRKAVDIGRRYLGPALLSSTLFCSGCAQDTSIPINPETKKVIVSKQQQEREKLQEKIERQKDSLECHLSKARKRFKRAISDGHFQVLEQKQVYEQYQSAEDSLRKVKSLTRKIGADEYTGMRMPEKDRTLYNLIGENLYELDYGTPELERVLDENDVEIKVESFGSLAEYAIPPFIFCVSAFFLACYATDKRKNQ